MKKNLLFCLALMLFASAAMANGAPTPEKRTNTKKEERRKKAESESRENQRTFHLTKCRDSEDKVFLMVGKKPNTKVIVKVYDRNGKLLYSERINAKRDFATILNLHEVDGPVIRVSDTSGIEKDYTL